MEALSYCQLMERCLAAEARVTELTAENVALKAVFSQKEIQSEAVDAFMETAVMDHDWNETSEWSWVENETEVIRAVLDALRPETPTTDRIVAAQRSAFVDEAVAMITESGALTFGDCLVALCQLREGAEHDN